MTNREIRSFVQKSASMCPRTFTVVLMALCSCMLMAQEQKTKSSSDNTELGIIDYVRKVMSFNHTVPQEKVYMHFDNTGYFEGETIWFKAYVTRTDLNRPTNLSRVLYVELVNPSGDVLKTGKYYIDEQGQARGDMKVDSLFGSGFYEVRAYTRYMTNWGVNSVFSRVFPVFKKPQEEGDYHDLTISTRLYQHRDPNNRNREDTLYLKAMQDGIYTNQAAKTLSVQFYPEGGDLMLGKRCRVAMLAVTDDGRPHQGVGQVVNEHGEVLATVTTDSLGRGSFMLIPDGTTLTLQMSNLKDKTQRFTLPAAKSDGCALTLDVVSDSILATLQCTDGLCGQLLGYALMSNGNIYYCDTLLASPLMELELSRSTMKDGVNQLTVFNSQGRILADRLFFICPKPSAADTITFSSETRWLKPCGKVSLDVQTLPGATFSFSAIDPGTMNNRKEGNLKTWMLLGSEVRGYIHNVSYYFEADDTPHRQAADLLMLTQGWRRYDWNIMAGHDSMGKLQPVEDKFYIDGTLNLYRTRNPVSGVKMQAILYNPSGQSLTGEGVTDEQGNYAFELPFIDGEWKLFFYTLRDDKKKTYRVGINRNFSPTPRYISPIETELRAPQGPNIFVHNEGEVVPEEEVFVPITRRNILLQNVTVKAKRRYFTSSDNLRYQNESYGRKWASIYYDIDHEREKILDEGLPEPDIFELLHKLNPLFSEPVYGPAYKRVGPNLVLDLESTGAIPAITYGGHSIMWIVDNGENQSEGASTSSLGGSGDEFFPCDLNEIKSVYIANFDPDAETREAAGISKVNIEKADGTSVRIYLYTHKRFTAASNKGIRRTYFQGFNLISTFQTEDYSVIPPMADFRRTIYWNPDVRADAQGKAKVEFYNNSTCEEMYINAEGMTSDGKMVVKE